MALSTILVVGATGNTGKSVVCSLPTLLESSSKSYRILGLTRDLNSAASKELAALPNIEMVEKDWTTIDAEWLRSHHVVRAYVAPHNLPDQFVDESALYTAMLDAGVEYVVKVSTNVKFIGPASPIYYGRAHWASENLLSQPEFEKLQWTSLQPNYFTVSFLASAVNWIKAYQATGKQELLALAPAADAPAAFIDPEDVGDVGAHLLALDDPTSHNRALYVLSGPEDVTGNDIVEAVEQYAGVKVQDVEFKSTTWLSDLIKQGLYPAKAHSSTLAGLKVLWQGESSLAATPTSNEILEIAPPKRTVANALQAMMNN